MVSNRCKMAVRQELQKLGLHFVLVELGVVDIMEDLSPELREELRIGLLSTGLELMEDKKAILIEKIKVEIIKSVHNPEEEKIKVKFSNFLSTKLGHSYTHLSNLFSEVQGMTIEQFAIAHRIERIKELLIYDELSLTEIAYKMQYSSVSHVSNQFKKITGMSPTTYRMLTNKRRHPLEEIGNIIGNENL